MSRDIDLEFHWLFDMDKSIIIGKLLYGEKTMHHHGNRGFQIQ